MAVVKNTFTTTLSDNISPTNYIITGLTSATSTTSVSYMWEEASLYLLQSIYQTLVDAGYTDAVMNKTDYSITVLGFKFFVLSQSYNSNFSSFPYVYTYGYSSGYSYYNTRYYSSSESNQRGWYSLNSYSNSGRTLSYNIIVRGDENCVQISYGSYMYPNSEVPIIFIAKAKNLVTSEDAFCWTYYFPEELTRDVNFRNKNNLYNNYIMTPNNASRYYYDNGFEPCHYDTGLNSQYKMVCEPVLGYHGCFYIYSMIKCNMSYFERGRYYKIGSDIYFCYGYKLDKSKYYDGAYLLFKVS